MDELPSSLDARSARRLFWLGALSFAIVTALLPPLCFPTFRSDVLEQIVIGREWVLGSAKHPALTTWIMQVFWVGLGGSRFAPSIAASVCATVTMWAVWRLGREYVPEREALLGALCLSAYWYTSLGGAAMYNNNVTLITAWHLAVLAFHHALRTNQTRFWVLAGLLVGVGLLCKYSAVVLAASIAVFLLGNADARRRLRTPGPWLALVATVVVFLPHAVFMVTAHGGAYAYLERKRMDVGLVRFCLILARDWLIQAAIAAPVLLVVAPLVGWPPRRSRRVPDTDYRAAFLPAMLVLPIAIQTLLQFVTRVPYLHRSYGSHLWVLLGLCALFMFEVRDERRRWRASSLGTIGFAAALLLSLPVATATASRFTTRANPRFYPGEDLARRIDEIWDDDCTGPCRYLATSRDGGYAGWAAAVFSRHQPHVVDPAMGQWARDEDLNTRGGVVIWKADSSDGRGGIPADVRRRFPGARFRGMLDLPYLMRHPDAPHVHVGVAVVAPAGSMRMAAEPKPVPR